MNFSIKIIGYLHEPCFVETCVVLNERKMLSAGYPSFPGDNFSYFDEWWELHPLTVILRQIIFQEDTFMVSKNSTFTVYFCAFDLTGGWKPHVFQWIWGHNGVSKSHLLSLWSSKSFLIDILWATAASNLQLFASVHLSTIEQCSGVHISCVQSVV